jgi:sigma-E factor negative regulatory protein RseB
MIFRVIFCGILLVFSANAIAGEKEVCSDWLKIVAFAGHQTDYSGVFVYQYDNNVESSRITHVTDSEAEFEKLEGLDGPKREIIRQNGHVWNYSNHEMVEMDSPQDRGRFPSLLPAQLSALSENYQAKQAGVDRVAGYDAQVILFQPKDGSLYAHKIWVHSNSGLLLKAVVLDDKNKVVEQYAFTQLQIGGDIDRSWLKSDAHAKHHSAKLFKQPTPTDHITAVNSGWAPDFLPKGFKKTMEVMRPMHGKHLPVTQIVCSDGLSAVSIFIELNDQDEDDVDGLSSRGAMSLYHKVVGKNLFTVVGEVPPHTVVKILHSLRYNGK